MRAGKGVPWGWIAAYLPLAYLGHLLGLAFRQSSAVSLFFLPAAITLVFLMEVGPAYAPLAILPHVLRSLTVFYPASLKVGLVLGLFHAHAYGLMAYLLTHQVRIHPRLESLRDVGWLVALGGTLPLLSGAAAMAFLASEGVIPPETQVLQTFQFWVGDLLALLLFVPLFLQWGVPALQGQGALRRPSRRFEVLEGTVQAGLLVLIPRLWSLLGPERGWAFLHLSFLPLLWIGLRHGMPGISLALPFAGLCIVGQAPALPQTLKAHPHDLSFFLIALAATALLMGAAFSERIRAQANERSQGERLRQLLDGTPITLATHKKGRFTYVNEAGARLLGYRHPQELVGRDVLDLVDGSSLELVQDRLRKAQAMAPLQGMAEERLIRADGGRIDVEVHAAGFLEEGEPAVQVVAVDITRRKEAERQLHALLREKETLLREVQHRVKNNLQVMGSLLNLQAAHASEPETARALRDVQDRLRTLTLIHQRLDPTPHPVPLDLSQFLEQLAQRLTRSYALQPGQVDLDLRMAPLRMGVEAATRLGMLLNELLSNSFKHAFPGGRRGRVEVRLWEEAGEVHLVMADDGPGLPPGQEVGSASTLGFEILRALTEQLKGTLQLEGGPGCTFHLRFPLPEAP